MHSNMNNTLTKLITRVLVGLYFVYLSVKLFGSADNSSEGSTVPSVAIKKELQILGKFYIIDKLVLKCMAQWLSWLERRPVTAEVTSSSLVWVDLGHGIARAKQGRAPWSRAKRVMCDCEAAQGLAQQGLISCVA